MTNIIPDEELIIDFARSGGPGGQNVNKVESKVILRWNIERSKAFSDAQKKMIRELLANRINKHGELILSSTEERSQLRNKEKVILKINDLVGGAIIPPKVRRKTKPSRASKMKRLDEKKRQSQKKALRKPPSLSS